MIIDANQSVQPFFTVVSNGAFFFDEFKAILGQKLFDGRSYVNL